MLKSIKCVGLINLDCSFFVSCGNVILWIHSNSVRVRKPILLKIIFVDDANSWQWTTHHYYYENCATVNSNDTTYHLYIFDTLHRNCNTTLSQNQLW